MFDDRFEEKRADNGRPEGGGGARELLEKSLGNAEGLIMFGEAEESLDRVEEVRNYEVEDDAVLGQRAEHGRASV